MVLTRFPPGEAVFTGRPLDEGLWREVDELLGAGLCPDGWLDVETAETRLTCLFHQSRTYLSGLTEPEAFSRVALREFPLRADQLEDAACSLTKADPVRVLLLAVHFRYRPELQATTDLVDLAHVLKVLAEDGHDAALGLERSGLRTLLFLQQGTPARVYFGDPADDPGRGSIAERFLAYAFDPQAPMTRLEVFKRLSIQQDEDAGLSLATLAEQAKPPPPTSVQVWLGGRMAMQRPFMAPAMRVGRDHTCELILDNLSVSRRHAELAWSRGRFSVRDLGSANGTRLNGKAVTEQPIEIGDRIGIGKFELRLAEPAAARDPDPTVLLQPGEELGEKPAGRLLLVGDDQSLPLDGEITIGKTRGVDVRARGFWVKAVHARVTSEGANAFRLSCPEKSAVQLNGQQVREAYLKAGDELVIGRSRFRLVAEPDTGSGSTSA
jgi:pSer/pThr/pTyr-binding forkhead associated (FHA) protein